MKTLLEKLEEYDTVRTISTDEGNLLYCGKDVANILGYRNSREAIKQHVELEDSVKHRLLTNGGRQEMTFIKEPGTYALILASKKPTGKVLSDWVMDEVFPFALEAKAASEGKTSMELIAEKLNIRFVPPVSKPKTYEIKILDYLGNPIRSCVTEEGELLLCGKDVAEVLGYKKPRDAIRNSVDVADAIRIGVRSGGQMREMTFINESGRDALVLGSRLPEAKKFKYWITSEVLPSLRKTGSYTMPGATPQYTIPQTFSEALLLAANQAKQLEEQQPKVEAYNILMDRGSNISITDTANIIGLGRNKFSQTLRDDKFTYKDKDGNIRPYATSKNRGLFVEVEGMRGDYNYMQTLITPKGRAYFANKYGAKVSTPAISSTDNEIKVKVRVG